MPGLVHPYIPNSVPAVKQEILREVGATSAGELYAEMIPQHLLLNRKMELPPPISAEGDLKRHVKDILKKNVTGYTSFLGGGCWSHFIPEVCDVIASRSEFLTAYAGGYYSDLGRFQANWEFQSLICDLLGMEVSGIPTYDWGSAAGNAVRMASRITGRHIVLAPSTSSPARLSVIRSFCNPTSMPNAIKVITVDSNLDGTMNFEDLNRKLTAKTAAVYIENPTYLGAIEHQAQEIADISHKAGALLVAGVDPITLGVLAPPADYCADIACGDLQPLGIHMQAGGGLSGFIASQDDPKIVAEYPLRMLSITTTTHGEHAFGQAAYERTSYASREKAKDWVGTTTALHGIIAAVYLTLLGPHGIREVGEAILSKSHYAAAKLQEVGATIPYPTFFKEYPLTIPRNRWSIINKALLRKGILGPKPLRREFPALGESALTCVTEIHTKHEIDSFADELEAQLQ